MIHCIGDSHSAFFSGVEDMQPQWPSIASNALPWFKSYRIGPATAYNLDSKRDLIESIYFSGLVAENDSVMFCFGEVDCRAHIIKQAALQGRGFHSVVEECVNRYIRSIEYYENYGRKILVWGPIASWNDSKPYTGPSYGTNLERNQVSKMFNEILSKECEQRGYTFVSIFEKMLNEDSTTNTLYLDNWEGSHMHLSQTAMPMTLEVFTEKGII
jgi:hypothetical protein